MKKLNIFFLTVLVTAVLSCKKNNTPVTTLEITVVDGATGSSAAGAAVMLYGTAGDAASGSPKYSGTADQSGKVKFTVSYLRQYFVLAVKTTEKNYYNGLIPTGIFKTQTEIQNSPAQTPSAVIGGVKFQDTNGDGAITAADDVAPPSVSITANTNNTFTTTIY
jgi:hypothetical protein